MQTYLSSREGRSHRVNGPGSIKPAQREENSSTLKRRCRQQRGISEVAHAWFYEVFAVGLNQPRREHLKRIRAGVLENIWTRPR